MAAFGWLADFVTTKLLRRGVAISYTREFGTTGTLTMKDLPRLIDSICSAYNNPDYAPSDGITYCNFACNAIAKAMGCMDLESKNANDIINYLSASRNWSKIAIQDAQFSANRGSLIFAGEKGDPHGHICVVMPGYEKFSGRWGKVPTVMNVGKNVFIGKGCNWAFQDLPEFYVWRNSL